MRKNLWIPVLVLSLILAACGAPAEPMPEKPLSLPSELPPTSAPPTEPPPPTATLPPTATPEPTATPLPELPPTEVKPLGPVADMQEVKFQASDGQELTASFWPAADCPARLVIVYFHWVGGDRHDFDVLGPWLQNRGLLEPYLQNPGAEPWKNPTWFPALPEGASYSVLAPTFRTCGEGGCQGMEPAGWKLDALAAVEYARSLPCVDPARVVTLGSSIGADAAAYACAELECLGAFSLSPGNFIENDYPRDARTVLERSEPLVACAAAGGEVQFCQSGPVDLPAYRVLDFDGQGHGNMLIRPEVLKDDKNVLEHLLEFLQALGG